jgi:outer membrane protein OmpA-like peptidoglycan-associated protein
MRRASVLAVSGICLSVPWIASAAQAPAEPAPTETAPVPDPGAPIPDSPPADADPAAGVGAEGPPALPDAAAPGAEPAPPAAEPTPETVDAGASVSLDSTGASADASATPPADIKPADEVGMVRGRREPQINSLRGGVGLFNSTLADVGGRNTVRFRLHTDFFRRTGFIYDSADNGADTHGRVRGTVNIGYSPLKFLEVFLAVHSAANRNTRNQPDRQDPPQQFALGDLDFGVKGAHRFVRGGAIGLGGQIGLGLVSGPSRLLTNKVNFNIDFLFTLDVRYLTRKHFPFRLTTNLGWILDNTGKLYAFDKVSDATSREVSRFALGIQPSRVRMRYGFDFPFRLGKEKQFGLDPIAELNWDVATQEMTAFRQEGATASPLPRSSLWATIGLRANVISGLHLDAAVDVGMVSPNFEYGPPVAPWQVILGLGWAIDPNPVIKEVPSTTPANIDAPAVIDGRVVGQVVDSTGAPVADAKVRFPGSATNAIVTDEGGNFTSFRFPEGDVTISVEMPNKATKDVTASIKPGEDTALTITMDVANTPPVGLFDATFTDEAGAPLAVSLSVSGMGVNEPFPADAAGRMRLELPAGDYTALAQAPGFDDKPLTFTVPIGDQPVQIKATLVKSVPLSTPNVIAKGKSIRLKKGIKYDGNNPSEKTLPLLDELAGFLRAHPEYEEIEIGVHSDDRGNPKQKTTERADNIRNYLLSKGVGGDRVKAVGFGDSRPIAVNMTASGRAKNNRTVLRATKYTKPAKPDAPAKPAAEEKP